jgi:hypothetical protein
MNERFLTISTTYIPEGECWLLISDYQWWHINHMEIKEWCNTCFDRGFRTEGMVIKFSCSEERLQFMLRWGQ